MSQKLNQSNCKKLSLKSEEFAEQDNWDSIEESQQVRFLFCICSSLFNLLHSITSSTRFWIKQYLFPPFTASSCLSNPELLLNAANCSERLVLSSNKATFFTSSSTSIWFFLNSANSATSLDSISFNSSNSVNKSVWLSPTCCTGMWVNLSNVQGAR